MGWPTGLKPIVDPSGDPLEDFNLSSIKVPPVGTRVRVYTLCIVRRFEISHAQQNRSIAVNTTLFLDSYQFKQILQLWGNLKFEKSFNLLESFKSLFLHARRWTQINSVCVSEFVN